MTLKMMLIMQLGLELVLVGLLLIIIWRMRPGRTDPARMPGTLQNTIERFLSESDEIAQAFEANLRDKKNLSADLILKLDRRLKDYQALLEQTEAAFKEAKGKIDSLTEAQKKMAAAAVKPVSSDKANPGAPEVRALVLQLAKKGHTVEEIAAKARLHRGEVELIIDLERQFSL